MRWRKKLKNIPDGPIIVTQKYKSFRPWVSSLYSKNGKLFNNEHRELEDDDLSMIVAWMPFPKPFEKQEKREKP